MFLFRKTPRQAPLLPPHQTFAVGLILSMLAGYLEAYTYLLRGGVFCNGQTANIAMMMLSFARGETSKALYYPIPILAFFLGIVFAAFLRERMHSLRRVRWEISFLALETLLLFAVGFVPQEAPNVMVNIAVTFVCAVQYETFRETRGLPYASIFCTGNLRTAAEYCYVFVAKRDPLAGKTFLRYLAVIGFFALGVWGGAHLAWLWGVRSSWVCCAMLLALMPLMLRQEN